MQQIKKVVLAYSGGVDTSVCIPYLKNEYGISEVITFVADLGQGEDLELIRQKALKSGASESIVGNLVNSFVERYAFPAIRANALYLDKYPLSTALARPLIAENLVNTAREIGADAVAHGCTGKGNDQVRFDLAITIFASASPSLIEFANSIFSSIEACLFSCIFSASKIFFGLIFSPYLSSY